MNTPSYLGEPRLVRLGQFLKEIKKGELYVPRFQRPFVWTKKQRLALLQSIYLGYPIGSILVWRTQKWTLQTYERLGAVRLPTQSPDSQMVRQYLLDGHQRMTTLFSSLGPGLYEEEALQAVLVDADDGPMWPIFFDLLEEGPQPFRVQRRKREAVPYTWLGLNILLDSYALGEFKDKLRAKGAARELVNRVQAIADTLRDYTIPIVPMATEDLEQVTTGFKRVNSGGSKMSEVHMVNALTWNANFDLLERLDDLSRSLEPEGWGGFDQQMIMNVCKARFEIDIYKASAEDLAKGLKQDPGVLNEARDAIVKAGQLLRRLVGVHGPAALPYSYQAVLLADALSDGPSPSGAIEGEIRKWFWLTTLTEYFQSMTGSLFRRAQLHLRDLVAGQATAKPPDLPDVIDPLLRFDFRGARSRAIALLLAELEPRTPDGSHFEAAAQLAQHGNDALVRLIDNSEQLAAGPENRFLLPLREGRNLRLALDFPAGDDISVLLESHAIPEQAVLALKKGDESTFLIKRREAIWELERDRAKEVGLEYREPNPNGE